MEQHLIAEVTQSAIITYNKKILILELADYPWRRVFPGWRINKWEKRFEWLKREVKEEINRDDLTIKWVITIDNWTTKTWDQIGIFYLCNVEWEEIELSWEHCNYHRIWAHKDVTLFNFYHPLLGDIIKHVLEKQDDIGTIFF